MSRIVAVVAHTHWDREWYAPFETYRARLVSLVDQLIATLDADPQFSHFLLDGQVAIADDFLEVRPAEKPKLQELIKDRRIAIGPWYVLPDEFCVSGETLVRNLQLGLSRAAELGGSSGVGYLPDMFGHVAQMPQILRLAGLSHAVVWRGVPSGVLSTGFYWSSPDGTTVRAEYLPVGYANGAALPSEPEPLIRRVEAHEEEIGRFLRPGWPLLLMNGGDHVGFHAGLPSLLAEANAAQSGLRFEQTDLRSHLDSAPTEDLSIWTGELRSGARANLLPGVLSTHVDIKVAAAEVERALEKLAEPLCALWLPEHLWPAEVLEPAWLAVIRNSAHDSICGCSTDAVVRAVIQRYDSARALAAVACSRACEIAAVAGREAGPLVLNPSQSPRMAVVELDLAGAGGPPPGGQVLSTVEAGVESRLGLGADLARILGELAADGWLGEGASPTEASISESAGELLISLVHDPVRSPDPGTAPVMAEAWARAGAWRERPMRVVVRREPAQRVAVPVGPVDGYGWQAWQANRRESLPPVEMDGTSRMSNGLTDVSVERVTGTFSLNGLGPMDLLTDEPDLGDTYNFCADASRWEGSPGARSEATPRIDLEAVERGPARGRIVVTRSWGDSAAPLRITTTIELQAGDPMVRITARVDNRRLDHRLRSVFSLPEAARSTVSECAFALVERGEPEGGPHEPAMATYPSRRFVSAGGLTIFHDGLLEHELVDGGSALAITLLRCTGILSRPAIPARPNVAGPPTAVPAAQMQGVQTLRYAVAIGDVDPWEAAENAFTPLVVVGSVGGGKLAPAGSRLTVRGARVSALQRRRGQVEVRLFNPSPAVAMVEIPGHTGTLIDLLDAPLANWDQSFEIRPFGIVTARLDRLTLD